MSPESVSSHPRGNGVTGNGRVIIVVTRARKYWPWHHVIIITEYLTSFSIVWSGCMTFKPSLAALLCAYSVPRMDVASRNLAVDQTLPCQIPLSSWLMACNMHLHSHLRLLIFWLKLTIVRYFRLEQCIKKTRAGVHWLVKQGNGWETQRNTLWLQEWGKIHCHVTCWPAPQQSIEGFQWCVCVDLCRRCRPWIRRWIHRRPWRPCRTSRKKTWRWEWPRRWVRTHARTHAHARSIFQKPAQTVHCPLLIDLCSLPPLPLSLHSQRHVGRDLRCLWRRGGIPGHRQPGAGWDRHRDLRKGEEDPRPRVTVGRASRRHPPRWRLSTLLDV